MYTNFEALASNILLLSRNIAINIVQSFLFQVNHEPCLNHGGGV